MKDNDDSQDGKVEQVSNNCKDNSPGFKFDYLCFELHINPALLEILVPINMDDHCQPVNLVDEDKCVIICIKNKAELDGIRVPMRLHYSQDQH